MPPIILAAAANTPVFVSGHGRLWIGSFLTDVDAAIAACVAAKSKSEGPLVATISLKKEVCLFRPIESTPGHDRSFELVFKQ